MGRGFRTLGVACLGALALFGSACVPEQPGGGGNQAPVAAFTADPTSGVAPLEVQFNAGASSDPDGTVASYSWTFGDGGTASGVSPFHTFTAAGTSTVTLTVTDNAGATDTETTTITVTGAPINQAPTASFTATPDAGTAPLVVTFDSSASADPDGSIESYAWDFGDGSASTDANPSHTFGAVGSPVVTLTVTDDDGATGTTTHVVTVAANQPPVAAGTATPTSGRAPLVVSFDAAGSADPEGGTLTYAWAFGDGVTAFGATAQHTYAVGDWVAELTVTDDRGQSDTRQFTITAAANQPPFAAAQALPGTGEAPMTVQFDSSLSTDDLGIVSYLWDFDDAGATSTEANPVHTFLNPGGYDVHLTVTDADGASHTSSVGVAATAPNEPPSAVAAASLTSGKAPLAVTFDGTASTDDRGIASYAWDFGDGATSTLAEPSHTFAAGTWTVGLTVTDTDGVSDTDVITIVVAPNQAPTAVATADALVGKAPLAVTFDGTDSADADGSITSYAWDFGDGGSSTLPGPSHTFTAGTHTVTLTVTDDSGDTDVASLTLVATPNTPPTAAANANHQSGARPLVVDFTSSSVDPDGSIVSFAWDFGDGGTSAAEEPTHTFAAGTWSVTLTVTDDSGAAATSAPIVITAYVDDDGDGVSPPTDCDDTAAGTYPGAPDAFDDGVDADCDGVDGPVAGQLFVKATGGVDSGTCGTLTAPCASIAGADARATATGVQRITVAGGTYARFTVTPGRTIRGGYGQNFLRGSAATAPTTTTINASLDASIGGPVGIVATNVNSATSISDLTVAGTTAAAGQSSYGIVIRSSSALTLTRLTVNAGTGGAGSDGSGGASASQAAANGGGGGEAAEQASAACSTSRKSGGGGGTTSVAGANGGGGGQGGARDSSCPFGSFDSTSGIGGGNAATVVGSLGTGGGGGARCDCSVAGTGGDGQPGRTSHGSGGGAGTFAVANGTIDASGLWSATNGTGGNGTLGLDGTGGGGGGGGGGNDSGTDSMGAGGGGGGAGGARATAFGTGGTPGRASIGISIVGSTPTLTDVVVNLGTGGKGGNGGAGGLGQPGGAAGPGGTTNNPGGRGGNGGAGGSGGSAGAGGGGAGGPSLGLAVKSSTISGNAVTYQGGTGGAGGNAGTTGIAGTAGTAGARTTLANV